MSLRAGDIMQANVVTVRPDMPLPELEDLLIRERISGVPVTKGEHLVGIVSRTDIVRAFSLERSLAGVVAGSMEQDEFAPAAQPEPSFRPTDLSSPMEVRTVRDIMAVDPVRVTPDTPVREVAQLLISQHLHRVIVAEGTRLVGIISASDLVRLIADGRLG